MPARPAGTAGVGTFEQMPVDDVIEHGERPFERRLRALRLRVAGGVALAEGILVVAGILPWWLVIVLALVAVGTYVGVGRTHPRSGVRTGTWIAAVSQLVVAVVPALVAIAVTLAVVALVLGAIAVLVALFLDRR